MTALTQSKEAAEKQRQMLQEADEEYTAYLQNLLEDLDIWNIQHPLVRPFIMNLRESIRNEIDITIVKRFKR